MPARARLARSIPRVEELPLPWRPSLPQVRPRVWLADAAPTRRSIAIGFAALAVALVIVTPLSFLLNRRVLARKRGTLGP